MPSENLKHRVKELHQVALTEGTAGVQAALALAAELCVSSATGTGSRDVRQAGDALLQVLAALGLPEERRTEVRQILASSSIASAHCW